MTEGTGERGSAPQPALRGFESMGGARPDPSARARDLFPLPMPSSLKLPKGLSDFPTQCPKVESQMPASRDGEGSGFCPQLDGGQA